MDMSISLIATLVVAVYALLLTLKNLIQAGKRSWLMAVVRLGVTVAAASTLEKDFEGTTGNKEAARKVGQMVAERAKAKGIEEVVFDRGGYVYHGRVQALAEAAREGGLKF